MKFGAGRTSDVRKPSTEYGIASLSRFKESSPSGRLGRLTYRLVSVPEIAPLSRENGSGSGCWRRRKWSCPLGESDPRRLPTTLDHRLGPSYYECVPQGIPDGCPANG